MRKLLPLFLLLLAAPVFADSAAGRSQSYFTFDDGGTMVRQGDDGKEVEARVNFPVYPGDEVTTSRRGRAEIRLSDGNVIALDRGTQIKFGGIRDSVDADNNGNQTVIELHYGHVALERDSDDRDPVRLDTESASFAATERAVYSVDTEREHGAVRVFDGSIEVRTPSRTTRVRSGEEGRLDDKGLYDLVSIGRTGADDFERWFLGRSEVYRRGSSRYLDRSLAYADPDLERYGSWVYASDYGSWCWRPVIMSVGWRPYYNGYWHHGRGGSLVWVSYDPWGWVPYHYGRWAYDPGYGWVWMPGYAYSPAWVYWMYGSGYVGWAPAGWYDCYRPYYGWAYRPYARVSIGVGFGFYGRVRLHDIDLRPWTFVEPGHFVGSRIDRVALRNEVIRERFGHQGGGYATVSGATARFSRAELRDPAAAIGNVARRGNTGEMHSADMTPFFRRDAALAPAVREHIVRSGVPPSAVTPRGVGSGVPTPGTGGTLEGRVPRDGGGSRHGETPATGGTLGAGSGVGTIGDTRQHRDPATSTTRDTAWRNRDNNGTVRRGGETPSVTAPRDTVTTPRDNTNPQRDRGNWRDRDRSSVNPGAQPRENVNPQPRDLRDSSVNRDNWRGRGNDGANHGSVRESTPRDSGSRSDVPRRIIDGIGGPRISGERPSRSSGGGSSNGGNSGGSRSGNSGGGKSSSSSSGKSGGGESHHSKRGN